MAIETAQSLVEALRGLELLEPARLEQLERKLAGRCPPPRDLARQLLQAHWLTAFQVNQLLQGRGADLVLGPYVLLDRLGAGGMGEVFKALHRGLRRLAAVKVVSRECSRREALVQRFLREAEAAAQLSHPNIVAVHDAGAEGERYYLVMELVDGIDLGRLVAQAGPLPVGLACDFIRQAALGLQHAHELDFVHRDVKPANLLVAPPGGLKREAPVNDFEPFRSAAVKILDMGLVRLQSERVEATELALTQNGIVLGTMDYLSPEQARNSHRVDHRADLYSLGCTLYCLLAGQPPFAGGQPLDKLLRHQTEPPPPLSRYRPDVSARLEGLVERLLAKRPEDRPASAHDVALELADLAGEGPQMVEFVAPDPSEPAADPLAPTRCLECDWSHLEETAGTIVPPRRSSAVRRRPRPRRPVWWWLAGTVVALGLMAALAGKLLVAPPASRAERPPPAPADPLADHVPADSAAVLSVKPAELVRAPVFQEPRTPDRALRSDPALANLFEVLSVDLVRDVSWLRIHVPADRPAEPLWLARGRFQPGRFSRGAELGDDAGDPGGAWDRFRYRPRGSPETFLAVRGPYLLFSPAHQRVAATLEQADRSQQTPVANEVLRRLLARVDRRQTVWLAATPPRLVGLPRLSRDPALQGVVGDVLRHATAVYGGVSCGGDLKVSFVLEGRDEAGLRPIVQKLELIKKMARGWLFLFPKAARDQRLWFLLLAEIQCTLRGTTLTVQSQVGPPP